MARFLLCCVVLLLLLEPDVVQIDYYVYDRACGGLVLLEHLDGSGPPFTLAKQTLRGLEEGDVIRVLWLGNIRLQVRPAVEESRRRRDYMDDLLERLVTQD